MTEKIFTVMEFWGDKDPACSGNAADWSLYVADDKSREFMSAADAQRRALVKAYFPSETEAKEAGDAASTRKGLVSVLPVRYDVRIPVAQLRWIVGNMLVSTTDDEVNAEIVNRAGNWPLGHDPDYLAQACAYALASHRANQGLFKHFRF